MDFHGFTWHRTKKGVLFKKRCFDKECHSLHFAPKIWGGLRLQVPCCQKGEPWNGHTIFLGAVPRFGLFGSVRFSFRVLYLGLRVGSVFVEGTLFGGLRETERNTNPFCGVPEKKRKTTPTHLISGVPLNKKQHKQRGPLIKKTKTLVSGF